jgi:hypothetical protein
MVELVPEYRSFFEVGMHRILFLPDIGSRLIQKLDIGYPAGYLVSQLYF